MIRGEKKALSFPLWLEVILIAVMLIMAVIEFIHGGWIWSALFGFFGIAFGISLVARAFGGGHNGHR